MSYNEKLKNTYGYRPINAIETERRYQEFMWNKDTTESAGMHSNSEFLIFIQDYLREAISQVSRKAEPQASIGAAHTVRKITAMCVACAEKNNWEDKFYSSITELNNSIESRKEPKSVVSGLAIIQGLVNRGTIEFSLLLDEDVLENIILTIFIWGMGIMSIDNKYSPLRKEGI
jgi:hypothetical protein